MQHAAVFAALYYNMSIIIHFNTAPFIPSAAVPSTPPCLTKRTTTVEMVPGIEHSDGTVMTDDESSIFDIATSNTLYTHSVKEARSHNHSLGGCFGLPYQDHNYGAPPPPTPPSYSPCPSPAPANGVPDEDTNLSIVSTSTTNEETQEGSITRCICDFEHDDEYMICCDLCLVWQHVDCMGLDRNNIPETYLCEKCEPRKVDRHKAKLLQNRKKVAMTDTSDSDEEGSNKNAERRPKTRSRKKKKEEKIEEKVEQVNIRKSKSLCKPSKERLEMKRSKLRRNKNKESTSTADEEAQDAWEYSLEWCEKNFETAISNQYTPEVQQIARLLPVLGHEKRFHEELKIRKCRVIDGSKKQLVCMCDLPRDQPLIEYKGKFLCASQFHELHPLFNRRLYPFVLFYNLNHEEICIDASMYGNDARFVRRSCKANAELHHMAFNGNLHVYLMSTKVIFKDDEVTLPIDLNSKDCKDIECACGTDDCLLKPTKKNGVLEASHERKRRRRMTSSADDDSSHSLIASSPVKSQSKSSPVKNSTVNNQNVTAGSMSEHSDTKGLSEHETEEQAIERKKKMTREERKLDAIMRAFDRMEKANQRRQQALERMKAQHPKSEESAEKSESIEKTAVKEEEKSSAVSGSETQGGDEDKIVVQNSKPRKSKRRRGSGTPSRRRTRTNSGGSDILSPDETVSLKSVPVSISPPAVVPEPTSPLPSPPTVSVTSAETPATVSLASVSPTSGVTFDTVPTPPPPPPPPRPLLPVVLKTKRSLMQEWQKSIQEKSEPAVSTPTTSSLTIHTEVKWDMRAPTCYVRCTKDNPHSGGISAAHLRRSNSLTHMKPMQLKSSCEQGSAKKRWLRQAMYDCNSCEEQLSIDPGSMEALPSPSDNGYLSPISHGDMSSPGPLVDDILTPLKKRRLMRESVESLPSPLSPSITSYADCASVAISNSLSSEVSVESTSDVREENLLCIANHLSPTSSARNDDSVMKINGSATELEAVAEDIKINGETEADNLSHSSSPENDPHVNNASDDTVQCKPMEFSVQNGDTGADAKDIETENIQIPCDSHSSSDNSATVECPSETPTAVQETGTTLNLEPEVKSSIEETCDQVCELGIAPLDVDSPKNSYLVQHEHVIAQTHSSDLCNSESVNNTVEFMPTILPVIQTLPPSEEKSSLHEKITEKAVVTDAESSEKTKLNHNASSSENSDDSNSKMILNQCDMRSTSSDSVETTSIIDHNVNSIDTVVDSVSSMCPNLESSMVSSSDSTSSCSSSRISPSEDKLDSNPQSKEPAETDSKVLSPATESPVQSTTCASATQKRKVSLSEYRMRMKDSSGKLRSNSDTVRKCVSSPAICATAIPDTLPEQVTLAPLPLFDPSIGSKSPSQTNVKTITSAKIIGSDKDSVQNISRSKKKKELANSISEGAIQSDVEHRENLTERLKREFGFDDDSEGGNQTSCNRNQTKSLNSVTSNAAGSIIPVCAQPPPPPPPRTPRPPPVNKLPPTPFGFAVATAYPRPQYIIAQMSGAPYLQQPLATPVLPGLHPLNPATAQPGLRPTLLTFKPVLRTNAPQDYSSVNAQSFASFVQQPPPPPPPPPPHKAYHPHVYQPGLFK